MDYQYDIFVSYKRHAESKYWLDAHFQPLLETYVELELGYKPSVFRDDQVIEAGATWPVKIGQALGNSRVLLALWTKTYFHSEWCSRELASMLAREEDEQLRTSARPDGLIVPVILHDCTDLPPSLGAIQHVPLQKCFNVRMRRDSPLCEELTTLIANHIAPGVAAAIRAAPAWRAAWPLTNADAFHSALMRGDAPSQTKVPRFTP